MREPGPSGSAPALLQLSGVGVRVVGVLMLAGAMFMASAFAQDQKKIEAGRAIYNNYCATCHGDAMVSSGQTFDLRRLRENERARFENSVLNGKDQMPPWKGVLGAEQIDALWAYVRSNAN